MKITKTHWIMYLAITAGLLINGIGVLLFTYQGMYIKAGNCILIISFGVGWFYYLTKYRKSINPLIAPGVKAMKEFRKRKNLGQIAFGITAEELKENK